MTNQLELASLKREWIDESYAWLCKVLPDAGKFTSDDLHIWLEPATEKNWYGCVMAKLRCAGKIKEVGRVRSNRPERNGAKISLWETV